MVSILIFEKKLAIWSSIQILLTRYVASCLMCMSYHACIWYVAKNYLRHAFTKGSQGVSREVIKTGLFEPFFEGLTAQHLVSEQFR